MLIVEVITFKGSSLSWGGAEREREGKRWEHYISTGFFFIGFYTDNGALTGGHASSGVLFVKDGIILY